MAVWSSEQFGLAPSARGERPVGEAVLGVELLAVSDEVEVVGHV